MATTRSAPAATMAARRLALLTARTARKVSVA